MLNNLSAFLAYKVKKKLRKLILPGFDGLPFYDVLEFFIKGIKKGSVSVRASSMAYHFFLAIFPAVIFLFTLLPYLPIQNFQVQLFDLLQEILPSNVFLASKNILNDLINNQRSGLLSFGFIAAMYFSTNGVNSMITAFNNTYHSIETRTWIKQRLIALMLTCLFILLLLLSIGLIILGSMALNMLVYYKIIETDIVYYLLLFGKWIVIFLLFFFAISFVYYYAPVKKARWRFISAGGTFATLLSILASLGFSYFINHFGQYNKIYGSIGTIMVIMVWLYINSFAILLGFELNTSIGSVSKFRKPILKMPFKNLKRNN